MPSSTECGAAPVSRVHGCARTGRSMVDSVMRLESTSSQASVCGCKRAGGKDLRRSMRRSKYFATESAHVLSRKTEGERRRRWSASTRVLPPGQLVDYATAADTLRQGMHIPLGPALRTMTLLAQCISRLRKQCVTPGLPCILNQHAEP